MTYYVTKYALSQGILTFRTGMEEVATDSSIYLSGRHLFIAEKDWFVDLDQAKERSKQMAIKKLKSLREQVDKLELIAEFGAKILDPT